MKKNNSAKELLQKLGTLLALIILIAIFWGVHSLSYLRACGKQKKS